MPDPTPEDQLSPAVRQALGLIRDPNTSDEDRQKLLEKVDQVAQKKGYNLSFERTPPAPEKPYVPQGQPDPKTGEQYLPEGVPESGIAPGRRFGKKEPLPTEYEPVEYSMSGLHTAVMPDYWYEPAGKSRAEQDAAWNEERARADAEGRRVKRHRDTSGLEYGLSGAMTYLAPIAHNAQVIKWGAPEAVLDATGGGEALDNVRGIAEGGIDLPGHQEIGIATGILASMHPRAWGNRVAGGLARGAGLAGEQVANLGRWGTRALRMGTAGAGAMLDSLGTSATRAIGETPDVLMGDGEYSQSIGEALDQAGDAFLYGSLLEPPAALIQRGAHAKMNATRSAARSGSQLANIEHAGGNTDLWSWTGLAPPPEIAQTRELQAMPRASAEEIAADPSLAERGMDAQDITVSRARNALHEGVAGYRNPISSRITNETNAYHDSPEGEVPAAAMDLVVERLQQRIQSGLGPDGRPLPAEETAADQRLLAELLSGSFDEGGAGQYTVEEARAMRLPFDEETISQAATDRVSGTPMLLNPATQTAASGPRTARVVSEPGRRVEGMTEAERLMTPEERLRLREQAEDAASVEPAAGEPPEPRYATPDEMIEQGHQINLDPLVRVEQRRLETNGRVSAQPRPPLNARQLERVISNYQQRIDLGNQRAEPTTAESEILPQLYELRREFPFNEHAPSPSGGYHGMRARHHEMMQDLEQVLTSAGLPRNLDVVDINSPEQQRAIESVVRAYRQSGGQTGTNREAWNQFLAERPGLQRHLDMAAAHRDLDTLEGKATNANVVRGHLSGSGASAYALTPQGFAQAAGHHLDPVMQDLAGVTRGGRPPKQDAALYPEGRGRSIPRASRLGSQAAQERERRAKKKRDAKKK